jgi:hypothetical protein
MPLFCSYLSKIKIFVTFLFNIIIHLKLVKNVLFKSNQLALPKIVNEIPFKIVNVIYDDKPNKNNNNV